MSPSGAWLCRDQLIGKHILLSSIIAWRLCAIVPPTLHLTNQEVYPTVLVPQGRALHCCHPFTRWPCTWRGSGLIAGTSRPPFHWTDNPFPGPISTTLYIPHRVRLCLHRQPARWHGKISRRWGCLALFYSIRGTWHESWANQRNVRQNGWPHNVICQFVERESKWWYIECICSRTTLQITYAFVIWGIFQQIIPLGAVTSKEEQVPHTSSVGINRPSSTRHCEVSLILSGL